GTELDDEGLGAAGAHRRDDAGSVGAAHTVGQAALLDVGAADVQLNEVHIGGGQALGALAVFLHAVAAQVGPGAGAQLLHHRQLVLDEVVHAGVLQADGVHQAGGGLVQALAPVAGLTGQGQALARDAAQQAQVLDGGVFLAEAEGAGSRDNGSGQSFAQKVYTQVTHSSNTSPASNTGPSLQTVLGPTLV